MDDSIDKSDKNKNSRLNHKLFLDYGMTYEVKSYLFEMYFKYIKLRPYINSLNKYRLLAV